MKEIKLRGKWGIGKFALIDDEDFERISKINWRLLKNGYVAKNCGDGFYLHRFIMDCPKGKYIDHFNHNPLDNRKENLRICTNAENNWNKNYGKITGVSSSKTLTNPWRAYIKIRDKQKHLGFFKTKIEAAKAYNEAVKTYRDKFSFLNVV